MSLPSDTDGSVGTTAVRLFVRRRLLRHVPPERSAATIVTIASRAEMEVRVVRDHFTCMSADVASYKRRGRIYYHRTTEARMVDEHDPTPLPERITTLLGAALFDDATHRYDGMTAIQLGGALHVRPNTVTASLKELMTDGVVHRSGAGKRGDPYQYATAFPNADHDEDESIEKMAADPGVTGDGAGPPDGADVAGTVEKHLAMMPGVENAGNEAATRRVTDERPAAGVEVSAETGAIPVDDDDLHRCYAIVIDDLRQLVDTARSNARTCEAVAIALHRILDGEADR